MYKLTKKPQCCSRNEHNEQRFERATICKSISYEQINRMNAILNIVFDLGFSSYIVIYNICKNNIVNIINNTYTRTYVLSKRYSELCSFCSFARNYLTINCLSVRFSVHYVHYVNTVKSKC
jgi:hypothetical protein